MERIKGDLIIETPFLFNFEVNERKSQETDKLVGFSIPVCLTEDIGHALTRMILARKKNMGSDFFQ